MATRKAIRQAFYSEVETAASGHVPATNIGHEEPTSEEDFPAIVHRDDYRKIPINEASSAPTAIKRDASGNATDEVYETLHEASFALTFLDEEANEVAREDAYEAVRSHFEKFEHRPWPVSDIQTDVEWVDVLDATSDDDADAAPTVRGDVLIIRLGFTRDHDRPVDATTTVTHAVDADDDGTTDETYTS